MFYSVHVDDAELDFKSHDLAICELLVELGLNKVRKCAQENALELNPLRIPCVLFPRKIALLAEPNVELHRQHIPGDTHISDSDGDDGCGEPTEESLRPRQASYCAPH